MPFIRAGAIDVHYVEAGKTNEGATVPLLLLGGTLGAVESDFGPQLTMFGRHHWVIAPDRPGYGRTRPPDRTYPDNFYQRDARSVLEFMDALELTSAAVLGWSEGADVALSVAALAPARVKKLVIWGGISCVEDADLAIFEARRDTERWSTKAQESLGAIYGDGYWQRTWRGWCDVMVRLHAAGGDVRLPRIEDISCPTLILHGAKDPLIRAIHPENLQRRIVHARTELIEDAGHQPHLTHSIEFNARVEAFLSGA